MKEFVLKFLSSIFYSLFLIPTLAAMLVTVMISERVFGFYFPGTGEIEVLLSVLCVGGIFFWTANIMIQKHEKLKSPNIIDHLRQSLLFYLLLASDVGKIISLTPGNRAGLRYGYMLVFIFISTWAILVNAVYLFKLHRGKK